MRKCLHTVRATCVLKKIHSAAKAILFFCFFLLKFGSCLLITVSIISLRKYSKTSV